MSASYHPPASFPPKTATERTALLEWLETTPLVYGPWQDFKRGFKTLEEAFAGGAEGPELLGAILSRVDAQEFPEHRKAPTGQTRPAPLFPGAIGSFLPGEGVIYVGTQQGTLVFDAGSTIKPEVVHQGKSRSAYNLQLTRVGNYLVENDGSFYDLSNPSAPRFVTRSGFNGRTLVALDENHLITYDTWQGLTIYRVPEAGSTNVTALGRMEGRIAGCCVSGQRGVVSLWRQGSRGQYKMYLLGLLNPSAPHLGVEFGESGEVPVSLEGNTLVSYSARQLKTYDVDGAKPRQLGSIDIPNIRSVKVHGDLAVVFTYAYSYQGPSTQALIFIDLSQPHDLRKVGEIGSAYTPQTLRIGNILWMGSQEGLHVLDISNPARAQYIGQEPSASTFAYLKRRGRRLLRMLAEGDEAAYLRLASEVLGRDQSEAIDFNKQWIEADLLVGNGTIWEQTRHGRGPVVRRSKFWRRRRIERAPEAWDTHLDDARELASRENLPWQTRVTLRRILKHNGLTPPPLSLNALEAILWGDWPFAAVEAARDAETRIAELSPRAVAALLWNVNPRRRQAILGGLSQRAGQSGRISPEVGSHLAALLGRDVASYSPQAGVQMSLTRRAREVALLLAARCDLSDRKFDGSGAQAALPVLLGAGEAPLRSLGLDLCRRLAPEQTLDVILMLPRVASNFRESFIEALCQSATRGKFELEILNARVRHEQPEVRAAVWRLIAASKTSNSVTRDVWTSVLRSLNFGYDYTTRTSRWNISSYLQTAFETLAALDVLARSGVDTRAIMRFGQLFWRSNPATPASVFTAYSLFVPTTDWVQAIAYAEDSLWSNWKGPWLRTISRYPDILAKFWATVQSELEGSKLNDALKSRLRTRTFEDGAVAATFAGAAGTLPPKLLLQLIGAVPDAVWQLWRSALLEKLQSDSATRAAFWEAARTVGINSDLLRVRLVEDRELAATFGLLENDALDFDDPALEALLLAWLENRSEVLNGGDLVRAAVHPLPEVRAWGLSRLQAKGLTVPVALSLLESDLPDAMNVAKHWFETSDGNVVDLALALCDSPHLQTRAYSRTFLASRLDLLLSQGLLARLQENPNAEMQSYVAQLLLERPSTTVGPDASDTTREFDRAVLRGRYRARKAKNLVQKRRNADKPLPDDQTLLELARGRTPRDADWAWTQLAKKALESGVENVEVSGVGGI